MTDFRILDHGTVVLILPMSDAAQRTSSPKDGKATAARHVPPDDSWAFRGHRTIGQVITDETIVTA